MQQEIFIDTSYLLDYFFGFHEATPETSKILEDLIDCYDLDRTWPQNNSFINEFWL